MNSVPIFCELERRTVGYNEVLFKSCIQIGLFQPAYSVHLDQRSGALSKNYLSIGREKYII